MTLVANWSYPTLIRFGAGRIAELADACRAAGITRPLFVTDRGLARMDIAARALDLLDAAGLGRAMFSDVDANPTDTNVQAGLKVYRAGGFDGIVAFGGGSALDLGKTLAFMAGQTRPLWDFEDVGDWWTRADPAGIHPIVAVPTTAGTGSEVGPGQRHHQRADARQEDHLPSEDAARGRHLRPRTDCRHAARHHRGHRAGRVRALRGSLLLAPFPPDESGDRAGRDAAGQGLSAARLRRRHRHRGAGADDGRRRDGRHGLSEGAWARSTRSATRSAPSTTPITAPPTPCACRRCCSSTAPRSPTSWRAPPLIWASTAALTGSAPMSTR